MIETFAVFWKHALVHLWGWWSLAAATYAALRPLGWIYARLMRQARAQRAVRARLRGFRAPRALLPLRSYRRRF